jgi:hypothetical protein
MRSSLKLLALAYTSLVAAFPEPAPAVDYNAYKGDNVITRDVCVIGGGSGGTYAATRLRQLDQSVIVIEKEDIMGGHTNTYTVPGSGLTIDYGVVFFHNISIVRDYFAYYKVPIGPASITNPTSSFNVDFRTGKVVEGFVSSDPSAALQTWVEQLNKYPYLTAGINLPDPVPADLLLPFKDFVKKYDLADMVQLISNLGQGYADLIDQPTLYSMKSFGLDLVRSVETGFVASTAHDNHAIYDAATAEYVNSRKKFPSLYLIEKILIC